MHTEISIAISFVLNFLYNKLPRLRVATFGEELSKHIMQKITDHWYPQEPLKGAAYRCLRVTGSHADEIIFLAAKFSGLEVLEIFAYLPPGFTLWIDPGEVSYRIGESGEVCVLYSESTMINENATEWSGSPTGSSDGESSPESINDLDGPSLSRGLSLNWKTLDSGMLTSDSPTNVSFCSSSTPSPDSVYPQTKQPSLQNPVSGFFTAASFAQTKFGSVKLKSQTRPSSHYFSSSNSRNIKDANSMCQQGKPPLITQLSAPVTFNHYNSLSSLNNQTYSLPITPQCRSIEIPIVFPPLPQRNIRHQSADRFSGYLSIHIPPIPPMHQ